MTCWLCVLSTFCNISIGRGLQLPIYVKLAYDWKANPGLKCTPYVKVFTAVTVKNIDFWNIKTQVLPHRRHITSPLQSQAG
jgi:hypothetical protein